MMTKETYTKTHCGTKQTDRYPKALAEEYFRLDERTMEDFVAQVARYSEQVSHYDVIGGKSTWESFFNIDMETLRQQMEEGNVAAHHALLLSFLKLYEKQQQQLNTILIRHRDFYFKDILGFTPRKGNLGTVPVFFELSKSASHVFVPKGTRFLAGKDAKGKPVCYKSVDDVSLNKATVSGCMKNMDDSLTSLNIGKANASQEESSLYHEVYVPIERFEKLDGTIVISLSAAAASAEKIEYTTAEGWKELTPSENALTINTADPHFAAYNKKVHKGNWAVESPLIRITCNKISQVAAIMSWAKSIEASISDSQVVEITNKYGMVENKKGAMVFGPLCGKYEFFKLKFPFKPSDSTLQYKMQLLSNGKEISSTLNHWTYSSTKEAYLLAVDTYDQNKYAVNLADYLVKSAIKKNVTKPEHYSALELGAPMTFAYKFTVEGNKAFAVTPSLGGEQMPNINAFLTSEDIFDSELYIELEGFAEKDTVSIYFDIDTYTKIDGMVHQWSYFDGSRWVLLDGNDIVKDTTDKLLQSGIVVLNIHDDNVKWLKASFIDEYPYAAIKDIRTQVVELEYDNTSSGKPQNGTALPAMTVTKPENAIAGITAVSQLYAGKAGIGDETDTQFECRVSETLRHKGRAWTAWDYERLVLEHYPEIASVQCYPSYNENWEMEAGAVLLCAIPQKTEKEGDSCLEPKVEETLLSDIRKYIGSRSSAQVTIYATNPQYDKVKVKCTVSLKKGYTDEVYYSNIIIQQLKSYLAPWINVEQNVSLSSRVVNESDIVAYISRLPFVDKLWDMQVTLNGNPVNRGTDICPASIGHLLTSDSNHEITIQSND